MQFSSSDSEQTVVLFGSEEPEAADGHFFVPDCHETATEFKKRVMVWLHHLPVQEVRQEVVLLETPVIDYIWEAETPQPQVYTKKDQPYSLTIYRRGVTAIAPIENEAPPPTTHSGADHTASVAAQSVLDDGSETPTSRKRSSSILRSCPSSKRRRQCSPAVGGLKIDQPINQPDKAVSTTKSPEPLSKRKPQFSPSHGRASTTISKGTGQTDEAASSIQELWNATIRKAAEEIEDSMPWQAVGPTPYSPESGAAFYKRLRNIYRMTSGISTLCGGGGGAIVIPYFGGCA